MLKKRILSSLLMLMFMFTFSSVTSVFAASEITWKVISNGQIMSNVTDNLDLVKSLDNGTEVKWISSKPHCVNTDGVVTRWDNDETVTLTAQYGSETRTFDIIVSSYKNGKTKWTDNSFNDTLIYASVKDGTTSAGNDQSAAFATIHSPTHWEYDKETDTLRSVRNFGSWGYKYGLTVAGISYKWDSLAAIEADVRLKNVKFIYNSSEYTFYYVDEDFYDANDDPYRVGVCVKSGASDATNWLSLYVNIQGDDLNVDTSRTLDVALKGYMKPNFEPVVSDSLYRSHLGLIDNGWTYTPLHTLTSDQLGQYRRFSFRYRQLPTGESVRWEPNFVFFYNNHAFAINPNGGIGRLSSHYYYGDLRVYYDNTDTSKMKSVNIVSSSSNVNKLGSATEPLTVKTSAEGLTAFPKLIYEHFSDWMEITLESDVAKARTVMYVNGQPVYWAVTVSGQTYYSPYLVHPRGNADNNRAGFAVSPDERLYIDYEVDSIKWEEITDAEVIAVAADPVVKSVEGNDAVINFARKGSFSVIFADYDGEDGALSKVSMESVNVAKAGDTTVTASVTPDVAWDKIFIWSVPGSMIPLCTSVNVADLPVTE